MQNIFLNEYKNTINNFIKEYYKDKFGKYNDLIGINRGLCTTDHPYWSNYNYINTNIVLLKEYIIPKLFTDTDKTIDKIYKELYSSNETSDIYKTFFQRLNEKLPTLICGKINEEKIVNFIWGLHGKGERIEQVAEKYLNEKYDNVFKNIGRGKLLDTYGHDFVITENGKNINIQVKSVYKIFKQGSNISAEVNYYSLKTDRLILVKENEFWRTVPKPHIKYEIYYFDLQNVHKKSKYIIIPEENIIDQKLLLTEFERKNKYIYEFNKIMN